MTDLIVDFPRRHENSLCVQGKSKEKRVQFSYMSEMTFFETNETDSSQIWYGPQEYREMRLENKQAVLDIHRRIRSSKDAVQGLDGCIITGLEHLVTPSIIKKTKERRTLCLRAVLEEQERQEDEGVNDPVLLANVSLSHSSWAVKRAHTVALLRVASHIKFEGSDALGYQQITVAFNRVHM